MNSAAQQCASLPRLAVGLVACFLGVTGAAHAQAANGNVINGCAQKQQGQLRVIGSGQQCRPDEVPISWNIQGPQGPVGPAGPQGDPGAPGIQGPPGVSALERVDFSSTNDSQKRKSAFARCPQGKHVVGGGAQVFIGEAGTVVGPVAIKKSLPSDAMDGWAATAEEVVDTDLRWFITAYALCATVAP